MNCEPNIFIFYIAEMTLRNYSSHSGLCSNSTQWYNKTFLFSHSLSTCQYININQEPRYHHVLTPIPSRTWHILRVLMVSPSPVMLHIIKDIVDSIDCYKTATCNTHRQHYMILLCYSPSTISCWCLAISVHKYAFSYSDALMVLVQLSAYI